MPPTPIAPCWPTTQRLQAAWAVIKGDVVSNESSVHNSGVNSPASPYAGDESSCVIQQRGWGHGISTASASVVSTGMVVG